MEVLERLGVGVGRRRRVAAQHVLQQDDVGAAITVTASYTDGGSTAETVTSAATNVRPAKGSTASSGRSATFVFPTTTSGTPGVPLDERAICYR